MLHAGDEAYGPLPSVLASEKFRELLASVLAHIEQSASSATLIEQFWLKEGHPAYPVFWDFAFVIASPLGVELFIGSRWVFFFHSLNFQYPLATPLGPISLPQPTPLPGHLSEIEYEAP